MSLVKRSLLFLLLFGLGLILFAPKKELYFLLEHRVLDPQGVALGSERLKEGPFGLDVKGAELYYRGIDIGRVRSISLWTLLFYSRFKLEDFALSKEMGALGNFSIKRAEVVVWPWSLQRIDIQAEGSFGKVRGWLDPVHRHLRLRWIKVGDLGLLRPYLRKDKKGWFYDRDF